MRAPIDGVRIPTSGAGAYLAPRSEGARLHAGVDLRANAATPVRAPEAGRVVEVYESSLYSDPPTAWHSRPPGWRGYGPAGLLIESESGLVHHLAHVDRVLVEVGDIVSEGAEVARGAGRTRHVHWEVRVVSRPRQGQATVDVTVSPEAWLRGELVGRAGACPPSPADDVRTPRECRPGLSPGENPTRAPATPRRGNTAGDGHG